MVQWFKNPTVEAWVATEAQVQSLAQCTHLKNPASPQHSYSVGHSCSLDLTPGLGLVYAVGAAIKKKLLKYS